MEQIAIVGAGEYARNLIPHVSRWSRIAYIVDNDSSKHNTTIMDIPVLPPKTLLAQPVDACLIAIKNIPFIIAIIKQLETYGQNKFLFIPPTFYEYSKLLGQPLDPALSMLRADTAEKPLLFYLECGIIDNCNLNCRGCTHFSPLFDEQTVYDLGQYKRDLIRITELFGPPVQFRIMGGEPFLNPDWPEYAEAARLRFPHTDLRIVTNGLLIPYLSVGMLDQLLELRINIDISCYPPTSDRQKELLGILDSHKIAYYFSPQVTEFYAPFSMEHAPDKWVYGCLGEHCINIRDGKIARCPSVLYVDNLNRVFDVSMPQQGGIFDLYSDISPYNLHSRLYSTIPLCRHCVQNKRPWGTLQKNRAQASDWFIDI